MRYSFSGFFVLSLFDLTSNIFSWVSAFKENNTSIYHIYFRLRMSFNNLFITSVIVITVIIPYSCLHWHGFLVFSSFIYTECTYVWSHINMHKFIRTHAHNVLFNSYRNDNRFHTRNSFVSTLGKINLKLATSKFKGMVLKVKIFKSSTIMTA